MKRILVFDVNETLLDLAGLDGAFREIFGDASVRHEWFSQLLQSALVSTVTGRYADFRAAGRAALEMTAERRAHALTDGDRQKVARAMTDLPPHRDVRPALERLRGEGFRLAALSNSPLAVSGAQLDHSGLRGLFEEVLSADEVKRLKPAPEPYRMAAERFLVSPDGIRLIAAHAWDVAGALAAGCAAAFVARPGRILDPLIPRPDVVGADLGEVAAQILALENGDR
ncbi:haloacid dehalogenase type II [soil metagenome]